MDCSPPGSSVHGIFQAEVLEWGAIAFSETVFYFELSLLGAALCPHYSACTSLVVVQRLSYFKAIGILVPPPRIEPAYPALQGGFLTAGP